MCLILCRCWEIPTFVLGQPSLDRKTLRHRISKSTSSGFCHPAVKNRQQNPPSSRGRPPLQKNFHCPLLPLLHLPSMTKEWQNRHRLRTPHMKLSMAEPSFDVFRTSLGLYQELGLALRPRNHQREPVQDRIELRYFSYPPRQRQLRHRCNLKQLPLLRLQI